MDNYFMIEKIRKMQAKIVREIERERKRKRKKIKDKKKHMVYVYQNKSYTIPAGSKTKFDFKVSFKPVKAVNIFTSTGGSMGKKRGYAKIKTYRKTSFKHTLHLLRIDTERELTKPPVKILSSEAYDINTCYENILKMHEPDERKGHRKQKIAYLEIFAAYENEELLKNYINKLSMRFNTDVYAIIHDDENVLHAHILVSWNDKNGKAIRVSKAMYKWLWRDAMKSLQPSRDNAFKKGSGLDAFKFEEYRKAWINGYYKEFVNKTREVRELFYQYEKENPHVNHLFKKQFFKEWLEEYENKIEIPYAKSKDFAMQSVALLNFTDDNKTASYQSENITVNDKEVIDEVTDKEVKEVTDKGVKEIDGNNTVNDKKFTDKDTDNKKVKKPYTLKLEFKNDVKKDEKNEVINNAKKDDVMNEVMNEVKNDNDFINEYIDYLNNYNDEDKILYDLFTETETEMKENKIENVFKLKPVKVRNKNTKFLKK